MHVLITADTVGGVWTYAQELVSGLLRRGNRITLVSVGSIPREGQTSWMDGLTGLDYRATDYRLEWMQEAERDVQASKDYLNALVEEVQPDILHLNQYCYGGLACDVPRIVVAHSDVVSWWVNVHCREPEETPWIAWYRETVNSGLQGADAIVAPSRWMLDAIVSHYSPSARRMVIYNGRSPELFDPDIRKEDLVLSVGRLWDAGKQINLLADHGQAVPVCIAGCENEPGMAAMRSMPQFVGQQSHEQLRALYARSSMYAATSRYEPFGLAPLEAALSRCAVIANDIPTFRELWGDSAYYFRTNDPASLAQVIRDLHENPQLRSTYSDRAYGRAIERFTADTMVDQYMHLYRSVAAGDRVA